jgi:hypothetical protein
LRRARAAWRKPPIWSRSRIPDDAARHAADDGAHGAADDGARDCAADDSGGCSIAVGERKLRRRDEGHGYGEKERFLMHEILQLHSSQYVVRHGDIATR